MRLIKSQHIHGLLQITSNSKLGLRQTLTSSSSSSMMIYGLIPPELHEQLLDHKNYQNRTNGIEELKTILSELDLKTISFDSIVEFIYFLRRLLDDTNFKVLYGTLRVLNLLVQKLDYDVDRYYKQITRVALKTLRDTRAVPRNEYMNIFQQLMRIVGPQKVLDLVTGHLKHKNSRVREDVLNIVIAAVLAHPRKDFNIPHLCFLVAPYLADSKKRVRHAALELFAVFDYCLDTGKKQPIMKAIDRVELTGNSQGLMAAVQARRARHVLPRLCEDGMVEYALVIPKPGQRRTPQFGSGADLEWILNGGRSNSVRSHRTNVNSEGLNAYSSLGSLTDEIPLQRRIVSAGKGKNKLPWERSSLPSAGNQEPCSALNGKLSDKSSLEDLTTSMKLNQESCVTQSGVPRTDQLLGSGNSNVEQAFSLSSNPTPPGSFLLPSYPLAMLPGVQLTPTLCSPTTPTISGTKSSPGNSTSKTCIPRLLSEKKKAPPSTMEPSPQGVQPQEKLLSDASVSVVGQRVSYSKGAAAEEKRRETSSPPHVRPAGREPLRALRPAKESQVHGTKTTPVSDMSEGVVGKGVFGSMVLPSRPKVAACPEQDESIKKASWEPPAGIYGHSVSGSHVDCDDSPEPNEATMRIFLGQERVKLSKIARDKMRQQAQPTPRMRIRHVTSEVTSDEAASLHDEIIPVTLKKDPNEQVELRPFSRPELALTQSFRLLNSDDWEKKIEGLMFLRCLARYHSDVLNSRLHEVCLAVIQEVRNLRSGVSRIAMVTLGELYSGLQKGMDQELEATAKVLLHKTRDTNAFIRQLADAALGSMVQNCTPTRSMNALLAGGLGHLNAAVRRCTAQHLTTVVKKIGTGRLLSGAKDLTDRILPAVSKLAQDSSPETRYFGRQMLLFLSSHRDFVKMVEKYIPPKDVATISVVTLKTKVSVRNIRSSKCMGPGEMPQDTRSTRGRRSISGDGMVHASSLTREPQISSSKDNSKAQFRSITDKTEYVKQLKALLASKDFQERIKGIDQLVTDCEENPYMVMGNIFPVFDVFKERLQESNRKVNLYALEALQKIITLLKDNLAQAVYILVPAVVDNHLNSKNNGIYTAATGAIRALINNLDNTLLLQPFCTKAQFVSGKAKLDLVDRVAELVRELYPRKPQLVKQKALPLLWHLLGSSCKNGTVHDRSGTMRGATTNLCQALHAHMGPMLLHQAASQPSNIFKSLNVILHTFTPLRNPR
ncbi:TOG array regulator of axonemal microtubules protein 1 isoform X1 [Ictalurus punctatus]|uniref:TOG array regulator of axonemal microtubules protein 1 isoform X1 n=1 Tax=Ictalurus punctatus TaxID=7998 RepID=A0A9F7RKZ0_ICTPU|nr:TOG array regulator of axonemal microtubules protein 1 isoform X1 [Ictalurus punctatus]XP_053538484.1 TOG array regulator of axonemal microtubules protein 1 isoform X1 [Ictalurus punctatus]XP_053538485.1 TOG array regulator of axonemal microtubules protein 1 isoform X1 [Ictalurus punctatus]